MPAPPPPPPSLNPKPPPPPPSRCPEFCGPYTCDLTLYPDCVDCVTLSLCKDVQHAATGETVADGAPGAESDSKGAALREQEKDSPHGRVEDLETTADTPLPPTVDPPDYHEHAPEPRPWEKVDLNLQPSSLEEEDLLGDGNALAYDDDFISHHTHPERYYQSMAMPPPPPLPRLLTPTAEGEAARQTPQREQTGPQAIPSSSTLLGFGAIGLIVWLGKRHITLDEEADGSTTSDGRVSRVACPRQISTALQALMTAAERKRPRGATIVPGGEEDEIDDDGHQHKSPHAPWNAEDVDTDGEPDAAEARDSASSASSTEPSSTRVGLTLPPAGRLDMD